MSFLEKLFESNLLYPSRAKGIYGRGARFEAVVNGIDGALTRIGRDFEAEGIYFPPQVDRSTIDVSGYYRSFPHLLGGVNTFCGCDSAPETSLRWDGNSSPSDIYLTPAACYPLYPIIAERGSLAAEGKTYTVQSFCFRAEPSEEPHRQQTFRMREFVHLGRADSIEAFRVRWYGSVEEFLKKIRLVGTRHVASDPFFGDEGEVVKRTQVERHLKFEMIVDIAQRPVACVSFNNHLDTFGKKWNLELSNGDVVHSGCVAFGLERLALALFSQHGVDEAKWPYEVREELNLLS